MPDAVLMPAPVNATMRRAGRASATRVANNRFSAPSPRGGDGTGPFRNWFASFTRALLSRRLSSNCSPLGGGEESLAFLEGVEAPRPPGAEEGGYGQQRRAAGRRAGAAADLAGHDEGAQAALGGVVGGGDRRVGHEDEECLQVLVDALAERALRRDGRRQGVRRRFRRRGVGRVGGRRRGRRRQERRAEGGQLGLEGPRRVTPRRRVGAAEGPRPRSEERRVGKECRSRWSPYHYNKKAIEKLVVFKIDLDKCGTFFNLAGYQRFGELFFFQAEDGIRDGHVTGVQTCALPI